MEISIIIATWNVARTLQTCLDLIVPQLTDDTELILVDGGSTDSTNSIIASYGNKISVHISEPDNGIYDAWNKGIKVSHGEWLMFVGADDRLEPDALEKYHSFLTHNKVDDVDFISAKVKSVTQCGAFIRYAGRLWSYRRCRINMDVIHVASLTSKRYFERVGNFNTSYKICGDYELLLRGGPLMKAQFCDRLIVTMPIGGISFSTKGLKEQLLIKNRIGGVPKPLCYLIYLFQLLLFHTYKIRH